MSRVDFRFVIGFLVLVIGASIALDVLFTIHLPLVPLAIAALFLAWGARMMMHSMSRRDRAPTSGEAWMSDRRFAPTGEIDAANRYDIAFGRGIVDLTNLDEPARDTVIDVDTVFGTAVVTVPRNLAYDVQGRAVFGEVRMPDHAMTAMGNISYRHATDHQPRLHIRVNTVFGATQVIEAAS